MNNWHGYHSTHGNSHPSFVPWHHLVLVKDFRVVELGLAPSSINGPIERQGVYIWHHLGSLQKKIIMLQMHKKNYENNLE
jgi:hypothetical protein